MIYTCNDGFVAFQITETTEAETFLSTRAGALAYFVGPAPLIPQFLGKKLGFASDRNWVRCGVKNDVVQGSSVGRSPCQLEGQAAASEKTWTFVRQIDGLVRIVLHHSSAPFDAR